MQTRLKVLQAVVWVCSLLALIYVAATIFSFFSPAGGVQKTGLNVAVLAVLVVVIVVGERARRSLQGRLSSGSAASGPAGFGDGERSR